MSDYEIRRFQIGGTDEQADPQTNAWFSAILLGFLGPNAPADKIAKFAAAFRVDETVLTGAYPAETPTGAWDVDAPVATFGDFVKTINIGPGRLLPAHLITFVTVRPTHRRRGLLRRMMSHNLDQAVAAGHALALLTVTEGGIYGRFGFGAATFTNSVTVESDHRFQMTTEPAGTVEVAEASVLTEIGPRVFAAFHQGQPGSVERTHESWGMIAGTFDPETGEPDPKVRAALHYDPAGEIDGFVSYKVERSEGSRRIEVLDLVAAGADAYLGLWRYLASVDLVTKVIYHEAPLHDPLPWALADPRVVGVTGRSDVLWVRVLDVAKALEQRGYTADGSVTLRVDDPMGYTDGTFRLDVAGGKGSVRQVGEDEAEVRVNIAELGSLYLGGVQPTVLAAAGRITEISAGAVGRLERLLQPERPVYGNTHF